MASVIVVSFALHDFRATKSGRKTLALYLPATTALSAIDTAIAAIAPKIEAAIDPAIIGVSITLPRALPTGLKGTGAVGQTVNIGANLSFDATNSDYAYGVYLPGWKEANFSGDTIINTTGTPGLLLNDVLVSDGWTNNNGDDVAAFLSGYRTKRK